MAAAWPGTLPIYTLKGSEVKTPKDSVLRTTVDVGPPMARNRYTSPLYFYKWRMQMTADQVDILMTWYHATLNKVGTFDFTHQLTSAVLELRFVSPPIATHLGGEEFTVAFDLETV